MKFASEEDRVKAMEALDPDAKDSAIELEKIQSAEIGVDDGTPAEGAAPVVEPVVEPPVEGVKYEITDLKGYRTPGELLKSYDNAQDLIARQAEELRKLREAPAVSDELIQARRELEELKRSKPAEAKEATADLKILQNERQRITGLLDELDKQADADPDIVFTAEYQKKQRDIVRASTKNSEAIEATLLQISSDLAETKKTQAEINQSKARETQEDRDRKAYEDLWKDMDSLDDPEYKTTTSKAVLKDNYLEWRNSVAIAYHGRPAKTEAEFSEAMVQLELKNPKLIEQCNLMKVATTPDSEMSAYLKTCELNLYRQGYRKNPMTGQYTAERRVMVPDGKGNKVPYIIPTLKEAMEKMRLEDGTYQRKADEAYQNGASDFAAAAQRRDRGAVTLSDKDQRIAAKTPEWAAQYLQSIDPDMVADSIRRGNTAGLTEYYEAMKILGQPVN